MQSCQEFLEDFCIFILRGWSCLRQIPPQAGEPFRMNPAYELNSNPLSYGSSIVPFRVNPSG